MRVVAGDLVAWDDLLEDAAEGVDLVVADTRPGLSDEDHRTATRDPRAGPGLGARARPVTGGGPMLEVLGAPVVFVLNKVDSRQRATREARAYLAEYGEVDGVEMPGHEHVHQAMHGASRS